MKIKNYIISKLAQTKQWILSIVRHMWLVGIVNRWNKLWIRKNEFHSSLDVDSEMMMHMSEHEREKYMMDLDRRRNIAHKRGLG